MALEDPILPRLYKNGNILFQQQLDAWRVASQEAFATVNLNFTQLAKDCFLSGYRYDNDGLANLNSSLQEQINLLAQGGTPISGTSSDSFTINTDGFSSTLSASGLSDYRTYTWPDVSGEFVLKDATQTLTAKTLAAPVLSGTATGTYTLAGTPTITAPAISNPTITGTASGTYTLAGTPTITAPAISNPTITGTATLNSGADLKVYSDVATTLKFQVDGSIGDVGIASGAKLYLDGAALSGDTYITESSSNVIQFVAGGGAATLSGAFLNLINGQEIIMSATKRIYLDGGVDTFIYEPSSNIVSIVTGGTTSGRFGTAGLLLEDVDPPTANYANRNSFIKAWGTYVANTVQALNTSYNCSLNTSTKQTAVQINFTTSFSSSTSYSAVVTSTTSGASTPVVTTKNAGSMIVTKGALDDDFDFICIGDQ